MARTVKITGPLALGIATLLFPEDALAGDPQGLIAAALCGTWISALVAAIVAIPAKQWLVRAWKLPDPPPSMQTYIMGAGFEFGLTTVGLFGLAWLLFGPGPLAGPFVAALALIVVYGYLQLLLVGGYQHKVERVLIFACVYPLFPVILSVLVNIIIFSVFEIR